MDSFVRIGRLDFIPAVTCRIKIRIVSSYEICFSKEKIHKVSPNMHAGINKYKIKMAIFIKALQKQVDLF